jgi:phage terminase large subunit
VERAVNNNHSVSEECPVHVGVDVARFGDDRTVIVTRRDKKVLSMIDYTKKSTMETVGYVMVEINKYKNVPVHVFVDDSGVGGGVTDRLNELNNRKDVFVNPVNNGSKAVNTEKFVNRGCELWWVMRENISEWDLPDDEELIGELTTRKYSMTSNGKIQIEKKDDMKKRGLLSPDKADALSLAFTDEISTGFVLDY